MKNKLKKDDENRNDFEKLNKLTNWKLSSELLFSNFAFQDYLFKNKIFIKSLRDNIKDSAKAKVIKTLKEYKYSFEYTYNLEIINALSVNDRHLTKSIDVPGVISATSD